MGRGAMEAPARRSGAEPRRTGLVRGGRRGVSWGSDVGDPRASRLGVADTECTCVWGAVALLLRPPTTLGFHHIVFSHLSTHSRFLPMLTLLLLTYLHPVDPSKNLRPLRMRASPPVFLSSLAFLHESTPPFRFHAYFFDVPLFFRPLQIRSKTRMMWIRILS
jgi:hypothetical protein